MNTINPMHEENEIILDIEQQQQEEEIENEDFYCEICCNYAKYPKKYKCNNEKCSAIICDNCFVEWSEKNKEYKCVYCTKPLEITFVPEINDLTVQVRARPKKNYICAKLIFFSTSSYFIGYTYTGKSSSTYIFLNFISGAITNVVIYLFITNCCMPITPATSTDAI